MVTQNTQNTQTTMTVNNSPKARRNRSEGQRNRQPRPAPTGEPSGELGVTGLAPEAIAAIGGNLNPRKTNNVFAMVDATVTRVAAEKARLMGSVRQRLAEAKELYGKGLGETEKAQEMSADAAFRLYQARTSGIVSQEEVSAALGDAFGWKQTAKGEPSKTPAQPGEMIRKRIVRAVAASEFVTGGDGGRFFVGLPEDSVRSVLNKVNDGDLSIFSAYDTLAELKRASADERIEFAFDPKKVAGLVEKLGEPGAKEKVLANEALIAGYGALIKILLIIGEQPVAKDEAKAA
jgi:hypothetical protein